MALVQAADVEEDRAVIHRVHSRHGNTISHRHNVVQHTTRAIKVNGVNARLHMCMNSKRQIVQCDHIHIGFTYDRNLVSAIMDQVPRFVHKHSIVYKMYTTLKLYYLHQQELLNQVLAILKEHIHSHQLAQTLHTYITRMEGKNFGWVSSIESLLKSHLKSTLDQRDMYAKITHMHLVHRLHTIIHHAATHHKAAISKMFHVLRKHGMVHYHFNHSLARHARHILHSVHHVFKHVSSVKHVIRHLRTHTKTVHHTSTVHHKSHVKVTVHKSSKTVNLKSLKKGTKKASK